MRVVLILCVPSQNDNAPCLAYLHGNSCEDLRCLSRDAYFSSCCANGHYVPEIVDMIIKWFCNKPD